MTNQDIPVSANVTGRIVPAELSSMAAVRASVRLWLVRLGRLLAYHVLRVPKYWLRLAVWSPRGLAVTVGWCWRWTRDRNRDAELAALGVNGGPMFATATERHLGVIRTKSTLMAVAGLVVFVGLLSAWAVNGWAVRVIFVVVGMAVLGAIGRPSEARPLADRDPVDASTPEFTTVLIDDALASLGISGLNQAYARAEKDPGYVAVQLVSEIARTGNGWNVHLDLPAGVTAGDVIERRAKLASGLRRPLGCVWPSVDPDAHEGRLVLDVIDQPMSKATAREWPLLKRGSVNVFEPFPIGVKPTGEPVTITLMFASGLIGAVPRMGKTAFMRLLCLAAALDPRVRLDLFDLKGSGDFRPLEPVAHTYRAGDDPDDLKAALAALREIRKEMRRRYAVIRDLPQEQVPESKITDAMASDRQLRMVPIFIAADEVQMWFESDHAAEFEEVCSDLVRRGPAVAIMAWFGTQRPNKASIPTVISANAILRFCLKVMGHTENDMVLGTGMHKAGYSATTFGRKDLGVGWLAGEGDDPVIVKADYVSTEAAQQVVARALTARQQGGWLTGQAAGEEADIDTDTSTVVDHLLQVWPSGAKAEHCQTLAELLAARWDRYGGWQAEQVTKAVKPHGVNSRDVKRDGVNRKGLTLEDLRKAAT